MVEKDTWHKSYRMLMNEDELTRIAFPNRPWFAVKCVFYDSINKLYEERITLFKAVNNEEALRKAEQDAEEVCEALEGYAYVGYAETFHLFEDRPEEGTEVYSTLRESNLDAKEYVKRYVRTGAEVGFKEDGK